MQSIPLTARSYGKIWEKHSSHAEIPQSSPTCVSVSRGLGGKFQKESEQMWAIIAPRSQKFLTTKKLERCTRHSSVQMKVKEEKRQQECKINNWDASREIYQIISTGKMVSLSPIEIPWTSFRVMKALMNSKCIPVLVLVQLQVNFLLPFPLGEESLTFISQVKIFSHYNIIL